LTTSTRTSAGARTRSARFSFRPIPSLTSATSLRSSRTRRGRHWRRCSVLAVIAPLAALLQLHEQGCAPRTIMPHLRVRSGGWGAVVRQRVPRESSEQRRAQPLGMASTGRHVVIGPRGLRRDSRPAQGSHKLEDRPLRRTLSPRTNGSIAWTQDSESPQPDSIFVTRPRGKGRRTSKRARRTRRCAPCSSN
jgi:hypothetical protein